MNNKVKALLQLKGENVSSYAKFTDRSSNNISNKISRSSWTVKDFIQLALLTNTRLAFIDNETNKEIISFDENDIKKEPTLD